MRPLPTTNTREFHPEPGSTRTQRTCGKCTACCIVMEIPTLEKPKHRACKHQGTKGCRIYSTRPEECATYTCKWLDGWLEPRHKPHRLGVVFDQVLKDEGGDAWAGIPYVVARQLRPKAFQGREAQVVIEALSKKMVVMLLLPGLRRLRGPRSLLDKLMARVSGGGGLEPIPGEPNKFNLKSPE